MKQILHLFPHNFNNYFEPFIGGGAVCFSLLPNNGTISDFDPFIIGIYHDVRDNLNDFLFYLGVFQNLFLDMDLYDLCVSVID